jgi:16S rRNA A1518/A1519 N6-dimethyltransferase RsmA/KsgA/DIM1 with predicted DNA glycosylase/AP lyase activity
VKHGNTATQSNTTGAKLPEESEARPTARRDEYDHTIRYGLRDRTRKRDYHRGARPRREARNVENDFRAFSVRTAEGKLFANIPYNQTAQILHTILHERSKLDEAFLILQKEAAQKFSGSPRETLCSILAKPFFEFQTLTKLKRTDFRPVPNVDSVLLSIKRRRRALLTSEEVAPFRDFVQYGFKRWKPNLRLAYKHVVTYKQWKRLARDVGFPLNATPTELSFEQWLDLYRTCMKSVRNPTPEVKLCSPE